MPRRLAALFFAASTLLLAQTTRATDLAAGKLLVASRELPDPNFAETVILLIHHDEDSVMGLVINRRTKVSISRVFQELKDAKGRSDRVYAGGPVERSVALALLRSRAEPEDAEHVFGDVFMISSKTLLEKTMEAGTKSSLFHVYLGYSGWSARQLENEVRLGAWYIFPGDAAMVFDPDPESLWSRLIRKTEERIAFAGHALAAAHETTESPCACMRAAPSGKKPHAHAWRFCSRSVQTWESLRADYGWSKALSDPLEDL